jgi:hypothetical protein
MEMWLDKRKRKSGTNLPEIPLIIEGEHDGHKSMQIAE